MRRKMQTWGHPMNPLSRLFPARRDDVITIQPDSVERRTQYPRPPKVNEHSPDYRSPGSVSGDVGSSSSNQRLDAFDPLAAATHEAHKLAGRLRALGIPVTMQGWTIVLGDEAIGPMTVLLSRIPLESE